MAGLRPRATDSNTDTENGRALGRVSRRRHVGGHGVGEPEAAPHGAWGLGGRQESMSGRVGG